MDKWSGRKNNGNYQTRIAKKNSKRIGAVKKEMEGFDISVEELNSIEIEDFGL